MNSKLQVIMEVCMVRHPCLTDID